MAEGETQKRSKRKPVSTISVALCSMSATGNIQLLYDKAIESRLAKRVVHVKMKSGSVLPVKDIEEFDVVILCHSKNWKSSQKIKGKYNELTELPYQYYQQFLRDAERVKGKECVAMVIHDMDMTLTLPEKDDRRQDFIDDYQNLTRYVSDVIVCGDISTVSSYCFDAVTEFDDENVRLLQKFLRRAARHVTEKKSKVEAHADDDPGCCMCFGRLLFGYSDETPGHEKGLSNGSAIRYDSMMENVDIELKSVPIQLEHSLDLYDSSSNPLLTSGTSYGSTYSQLTR
ncbi:uncharacterized protein LOC144443804 [Glandiceps talaboti]